VSAAPEDLVALGRRLFTEETFDGNGRVCSTCHELDGFGTITPEFVKALYAEDPDAPLFRGIDSDDGFGVSYERLMEHATIRIPIELPTRTVSGLGIRKCDDLTATTIWLNRGNPTVFNAALERHLMVDGRDGADLERQVHNAVHTHAEPGREPTARELTAIAAFQASLFSSAALREFLGAAAVAATQGSNRSALMLPEGHTPAEIRGRAFFAPDRQCGQCHSGPLLNRSSRFHPNGVGLATESSFVGAEPDNPNEKFDWCYVDLETGELAPGPSGTPQVFPAPVADPGIGLIVGLEEFQLAGGTPQLVANEILVSLAGPVFKIPTLWGTPDTAPYFHDNSAKTLEDVLDQYNFVFSFFPDGSFGLGCDRTRPVCLDERDKTDIIAFMQLLSFDTTLRSRGRSIESAPAK
jgi:cytochrome c peroxidase